MHIEALRCDKEALLAYVKRGIWSEGKRVVSFKLLPLRSWGGKQYLVALKINLTEDLPKLRVYDVSDVDVALFPDPYLENRQVGILSESPGWEHPLILLENGTGRLVDSSLLPLQVQPS